MGKVAAPVSYRLVDRHVGLIQFDRPAARNAVDGAVARMLHELVQHTEGDPAVRVVVLGSAHPGMFCAGADLKTVAAGRVEELRPGAAGFAGLVDAVRRKPWIAAVDGPAMGGGFELCLACDMIVASTASRFGLPEVKLGMMAGAGGVHRVARAIPRNIALELVATGRAMAAAEAARLGLVNRLVDADEVIPTALELARSIAANAPISVVESLTIARSVGDLSDADLRRVSRERMSQVMATADAREGPKAFVEKREPIWIGA